MSALFNLFYIYDPWFFHFLRMAFVTGIIVLVYLSYQMYKKQLVGGITVPLDSLVAIMALLLVSVLPLLINGSEDYAVLLMYCKSLLLFIFGIGIYHLFYSKQGGKQQFIRDLEIGIIVQAVFGFLALCGISFIIDFLLSTNIVLPRFYGSEQEYRLYNITSSAFFQLSAFYLILLHFLLAYNEKENNISSIYLLLILFIGVISGRTFFIFSILTIMLYFKRRYIPVLVVFIAIVLFLAKFYPENRYIAHALEPVINLLSNTGNSIDSLSDISSSTDTLVQKHLFIPEVKQLIIGDGYYFTEDKRYYGGSDSGFIRQVLYGGVGYSLVCLIFTWYFVRKISVNWFENSWKFTYSTLFILSVLNIKADTYAFPGIMFVLIMFLSLFGTNGKNIVLFKRD